MKDMYAQQKAHEDLQGLLASEAPGADAKAFAQGLAAGAAVPLVLAEALPWVSNINNTIGNLKAQTHVAALLQRSGMDEGDARKASAGALQYLRQVENMSPQAHEALSKGTTVRQLKPDIWNALTQGGRRVLSRQDELDALVSKSMPLDAVLQGAYHDAPAKLPRGSRIPHHTSQAILAEAERAFKQSGKSMPMGKMLARNFGSRVQRALPMAALLGGIGGIARVKASKRRRNTLQGIRKQAAEESMTDRALQAAPGIAAVPGFVLGAADTQTFAPRGLIGERAGRALGSPKGWKSRVVSGLVGAGALSTAAALPGMMRSSAQAIGGSKPADVSAAPVVIMQKRAYVLPHMVEELYKIGAAGEYAKDFVAGMDPFGAWTGGYGQAAERQGASEGKHRTKQMLGAAGGALGGAVVVPGAVGGIIGGVSGAASARGGLKARALAGAAGAVEGATMPFRSLFKAHQAQRATSRAIAAGGDVAFTPAESSAMRFVAGRVPVGEALPLGGKLRGAAPSSGNIDEYLQSARAAANSASKETKLDGLRTADAQTRSAVRKGVSQLGLGGAVGTAGAYVQYGKGRATEQAFQDRLTAAKRGKQ
tara:strand:- start:35 stop:1819 length:1785 start_codon:yes stop_codon:yes gene_type:complete